MNKSLVLEAELEKTRLCNYYTGETISQISMPIYIYTLQVFIL